TDGGTSWIAANTGLPDGYVRALAIDPQTPAILYVSISSYPRRLFKSADGGASWSASDGGLYDDIYVDALAIDPLTPTTLYAGTDAGVFVLEQRETGPPGADAGLDSAVEATVIFGLR